MNAFLQDVTLAANLRRIGILVRDWPGECLDEFGSLRLVEGEAAEPPIYWCFNAEQEFKALAKALTPQRSLVGMRSLNQVIDAVPANAHAIDALAAHYAERLLRRFGTTPCIVGGNCQAGGISYRIAMRMIAAGTPVRQLVTLDVEVPYPVPVPVRLLFGDASARNPFLHRAPDRERAPERNWRFAYRHAEWSLVKGVHGSYFTPEHVPILAAAIVARPPDIATPPAAAVVDWTVTTEGPDRITVQARAPAGLEAADDLAILPLWRREDGSLRRPEGDDWLVPLPAAPLWRCDIAAPEPGWRGRLTPVLCRLDRGPLTWPFSEAR